MGGRTFHIPSEVLLKGKNQCHPIGLMKKEHLRGKKIFTPKHSIIFTPKDN